MLHTWPDSRQTTSEQHLGVSTSLLLHSLQPHHHYFAADPPPIDLSDRPFTAMEAEQKHTESQPPSKKLCRTPPVRRTILSTDPLRQPSTKPLPAPDLAPPSTFMMGNEPEIVQARLQPEETKQEENIFPQGSIEDQAAYLDSFGESEIGMPMFEQLCPLLEELFQKEQYFRAAVVHNGQQDCPEAYRLKAHEPMSKRKLGEHPKESVFTTEIR